MIHTTEKFLFADKEGKEVEISSVPYSFVIEDILIKRFGKKALDEFAATHRLNYNITLKDAEEDLPQLLSVGSVNINWSTQQGKYFDEMCRVYYFFLQYKSNAQLRVLQSQSEILRLSLETMKTIFSSMPENILASMKAENTEDS